MLVARLDFSHSMFRSAISSALRALWWQAVDFFEFSVEVYSKFSV